jgi:3-oxoacyl-[acyl-carrier protein] reductase
MGKLENQVAVVTGASRGIGLAAARLLAREGAGVVLTARGADALESAAQQIVLEGGRAVPVPGDVSRSNDADRMIRTALDTFGRVDILVNNAGVMGTLKRVAEMDEESWDRVVGIHLKGTFLCSRAVLPSMLTAGYGRIINIASVLGQIGHPLGSSPGEPAAADYAAAKAGIIGFTKALAFEVSRAGITANVILPGPVLTFQQAHRTKEHLARVADATLIGRHAQPEELAEAILFLAGPKSSYITGAVLSVDGGAWLR